MCRTANCRGCAFDYGIAPCPIAKRREKSCYVEKSETPWSGEYCTKCDPTGAYGPKTVWTFEMLRDATQSSAIATPLPAPGQTVVSSGGVAFPMTGVKRSGTGIVDQGTSSGRAAPKAVASAGPARGRQPDWSASLYRETSQPRSFAQSPLAQQQPSAYEKQAGSQQQKPYSGTMPLPEKKERRMARQPITQADRAGYKDLQITYHPYDDELFDLGWAEPDIWGVWRRNPPTGNENTKTYDLNWRQQTAYVQVVDWPLPLPHEGWRAYKRRMNDNHPSVSVQELKLRYEWRNEFDKALRPPQKVLDEERSVIEEDVANSLMATGERGRRGISDRYGGRESSRSQSRGIAQSGSETQAPAPSTVGHQVEIRVGRLLYQAHTPADPPVLQPPEEPRGKLNFHDGIAPFPYYPLGEIGIFSNAPQDHLWANELAERGVYEPEAWKYLRTLSMSQWSGNTSDHWDAIKAVFGKSKFAFTLPLEDYEHFQKRQMEQNGRTDTVAMNMQFQWRETHDPMLSYKRRARSTKRSEKKGRQDPSAGGSGESGGRKKAPSSGAGGALLPFGTSVQAF